MPVPRGGAREREEERFPEPDLIDALDASYADGPDDRRQVDEVHSSSTGYRRSARR
jgi:hypothetical protein